MIYEADITTAANTAATAKKETKLKVTDGVIHQIDLYFPYGAQGLHHVQILDGNHHIAPSNPSQSFNGHDVQISGREHYVIVGGPREIRILTWNLDETYEHTVNVRIYLLPQKVFGLRQATQGLKTRLLGLLSGE